MALKDWKKTKETEEEVEWMKNFDRPYYRGGGISQNTINISKRSYNIEGFWYVREVNGNIAERKTFKTKSQAIAYAKSYMRKH